MSKKKPPKLDKSRQFRGPLVSQTELAKAFGVTTRTVQRWVELGLPRGGEGRAAKYPLHECIAWREARVREEMLALSPPLDSIEEAKRRKAIAEAELAEYDVGERRRELMTTDQHRDALKAALERVGQQLKTLEPRLSSEVIGVNTLQESRKIIRASVREVLEALYACEDVPEQAA